MTDYYTYHHLSKKSQITTRHTVSTLAYMAELFVFIYLGMSFFLEQGHEFRGGYVIVTLLLCFAGRALSVFPLAFLLNMGRKHKLPLKHQIVLWYSGLRGPVAYALAVATPDDGTLAANIILTTTIIIVAFTTLMLGGLAYPFLRWVKPPIMRSTSQTKTDTYDISNHWFNRLDRRFLRPFFGPKTRRNVNKPLSSVDDIEMEEQMTNNNSDDQDPKLQLMENGNKGGFDMEYVNTNTNEEEAEKQEEEKENRATTAPSSNTNRKTKRKKRKSSTEERKTDDVHLKVGDTTTDTPTGTTTANKSGVIDYSMPRTQAPSFIDNPREQSEQSNTQTWSDVNSMNQSQNNLGTSTTNLEPPIHENKSVTPPPTSVENTYMGD